MRWAVAAAVLPGAGAHAAGSSVSLDDFLRLSRRLTARAKLDPRVGSVYLEALLAVPANAQVLTQLVHAPASGANKPAPHLALEEAIIESWYTGTYEANGERRVATYGGALMWEAIGVTAAGTCAGEFGAWSRPPARKT